MCQVIISLLSGLAGVLVGAIINIVYDNKSEERKQRQDYIKICIAEWLKFKEEVLDLLAAPSKKNNTIYRQSFSTKVELLSYIGNTNDSKRKVKDLKERIRKEDEKIFLNSKSEECLNIGSDEASKTMLIRDIHTVVDIVLTELQKL